MKRELTADKPTPIKAPKSPRSIENELGDFITYMVAQMAQRYRNQVLNQLQAGTVEKFADAKVLVSREFAIVDHHVTATRSVLVDRPFTDSNGAEVLIEVYESEQYQQPVYRHERRQVSTACAGLHPNDWVIGFADAQAGNYASVLLKLSSQVKRKLLKQFNDGRIEAQTKEILTKLDKKSRQQFYERVAAKVGIDVKDLIAKEGMKSTTNALMLETAQWIKTLRDESLEKFTNNSLFGMSQGESLDTIVSQFDGIVEKRKNHAKFLARNQVQNYNSVSTKIRAQNLGIEKAIWITAGDERVRPSHADREGKEFDLATGLYSSVDDKDLLPGTDYNCFPGWSQLNHTSLCHKLYRRRYAGELVSLVFDDGVVLQSTANHPILTKTGFKPAHLINAGDDVVRCLDQGINTAELYGNRPVPTFEQIYRALDLLGVEHRVAPAISGKFHGDVSDSDVEVIAFDSELMREADASIRKKLSELEFSLADQVGVLVMLTCNRDARSVLRSMWPASNRLMRSLDLCRSLLIAHLTPLEQFRFALGSWGDALLDKSFSDDIPAHAKVFGDCVFAFSVLIHGGDLLAWKIDSARSALLLGQDDSSLIKMTLESGITNPRLFGDCGDSETILCELGRVTDAFRTEFSGHVYNLETATNDYITQTTAVSNCRCTYEMIIPESE